MIKLNVFKQHICTSLKLRQVLLVQSIGALFITSPQELRKDTTKLMQPSGILTMRYNRRREYICEDPLSATVLVTGPTIFQVKVTV